MVCAAQSPSAVSLRAASIGLLVAFVFHVIGYGLPRWFTIQITDSKVDFEGTYHMGLWQDCTCAPECYCVTKHAFNGWQRTVQAMQTLGLIGLTTSGICCIVILFGSPLSEKIKRMNLVVLLCSGICMSVGVIVFATERYGEYEELTSYLEVGAVTETHLNSSFVLSVIAAGLCLLLCAPLLLINLRSTRPADE